ncbi:Na+-dependent transporters of the SNF family [uncultured Eubacterium sp.]|nr:Na+-dependent transporters of the SNF family [uncultured Eubacterium sp.]
MEISIYGSGMGQDMDAIGGMFGSTASAWGNNLWLIIASWLILSSMAVGGAALDTADPGLRFIYLVNVFNGMPAGTIVGIVFYICVMLAGITSLINLYEVPVAALQEKVGFKQITAVGTIAAIGCIVTLLIQAIVSGWMDAVSIYVCPLGAMLAGIMFFYLAGKGYAEKAVNESAVKPIGPWVCNNGEICICPAGSHRADCRGNFWRNWLMNVKGKTDEHVGKN